MYRVSVDLYAYLQRLDYVWVQTGVVEADCCINNVAWNLEGTRLLTGGDSLQMWAPRHSPAHPEEGEVAMLVSLPSKISLSTQ